jgi:hypothetical protein
VQEELLPVQILDTLLEISISLSRELMGGRVNEQNAVLRWSGTSQPDASLLDVREEQCVRSSRQFSGYVI